jgi:hypothetical protein
MFQNGGAAAAHMRRIQHDVVGVGTQIKGRIAVMGNLISRMQMERSGFTGCSWAVIGVDMSTWRSPNGDVHVDQLAQLRVFALKNSKTGNPS